MFLIVHKKSYSSSKGSFMNKEQYARMLKDIRNAHKQGGDMSACIANYKDRFKYIYIYNDSIFKLLFGAPENESITIDFFNAILERTGSDCIDNLTYTTPAKEGATRRTQQLERISIEIQHEDDKPYCDPLILHSVKHQITNKYYGDSLWTQDFSHIELLLFDNFTNSKNYRHCEFFEHEEKQYSNLKQSLIFIEISKFLKSNFTYDQSHLARWLRFIDNLNNETPIETLKDSVFSLLKEKAKICNFSNDFLVSEATKISIFPS